MKSAKLIMTIGLPASGKSTWAKDQVAHGNGRIKRVNKDDLRAMLDKSWSKSNEKFVLKVRDFIINEALDEGYSIIVDDTNFAPKHREAFELIAQKRGAEFEVKDFTDVPLDVCIERDANRTASVGNGVILQMFNQWLKPKEQNTEFKPYEAPDGAPFAIICDIDGTLAHNNSGRNIYDYSKANLDDVDEHIAEIVNTYYKLGYKIIICSGREDDCKDVTEQWLEDNNIPYDYLFMRKAGDHRRDSIIKREIFDEHIRNRFNVRFVLDDRNQVVDNWREMGLKCLQVAPGDF